MSQKQERHIVNLSGGKDSTAMAIHLRDRVPDLEYVFCDTEKELDETYEYLDRLEAYLGTKVIRLKHDGRGFDHYLAVYGGYLPSARTRWCTKHLKLEVFERFVGHEQTISYVGIRADEARDGYISTKPNIKAVFPFKEAGITRQDVFRILDISGLGFPDYYRWRSRSGCYFCFFQQKIEWVGLLENHPDLFAAASRYEKEAVEGGKRYTWADRESLEELARPERVASIRAEHARRIAYETRWRGQKTLMEVLDDAFEWEGERACAICDL